MMRMNDAPLVGAHKTTPDKLVDSGGDAGRDFDPGLIRKRGLAFAASPQYAGCLGAWPAGTPE